MGHAPVADGNGGATEVSEPQDARKLTEDHPPDLYPSTCETCKARVIIHCPDCQIQVSACVCSLRKSVVSEIGEDGLRELEDQSRQDRLRQSGVWTPD
jgi:hypothetical protein